MQNQCQTNPFFVRFHLTFVGHFGENNVSRRTPKTAIDMCEFYKLTCSVVVKVPVVELTIHLGKNLLNFMTKFRQF